MLSMLFSSRVRSRILSLLILGSEGGMSTRAIAGKVKAQYSQVWSELRRLERAGLLRSESAGRMTLFRINPECAILPELRTMLIKTDGLGDTVRKALSGLPVKAAFVYGSFANGTADLVSDVDLMIIGEARMEKLALSRPAPGEGAWPTDELLGVPGCAVEGKSRPGGYVRGERDGGTESMADRR